MGSKCLHLLIRLLVKHKLSCFSWKTTLCSYGKCTWVLLYNSSYHQNWYLWIRFCIQKEIICENYVNCVTLFTQNVPFDFFILNGISNSSCQIKIRQLYLSVAITLFCANIFHPFVLALLFYKLCWQEFFQMTKMPLDT